jgi:hypothetical protein
VGVLEVSVESGECGGQRLIFVEWGGVICTVRHKKEREIENFTFLRRARPSLLRFPIVLLLLDQ